MFVKILTTAVHLGCSKAQMFCVDFNYNTEREREFAYFISYGHLENRVLTPNSLKKFKNLTSIMMNK